MFWQWSDSGERQKYADFADGITMRAGCSLLRYHLHIMRPELLDDDLWCDALADIWYNKMSERLASKES